MKSRVRACGYYSVMSSPLLRRVLRIAVSLILFAVGINVSVLAAASVPFGMSDGEPTEMTAAAAIVAILLWLTVFLRTRYPLVVLIAGALPALGWADCSLLLVGVFHMITRGSRRPAIIASAVGAVIVIGSTVRLCLGDQRDSAFGMIFLDASEYAALTDARAAEIILITCAAAAFGLLISIGGGMLVRQIRRAKRAEDRVEAEGDKNSLLAAEVARQSERQELARELHDTLSNRLSVLSLHAGALEVGDDPAAQESAQALRAEAHAALHDLRSVVEGAQAGTAAPKQEASDASLDRIPHLLESAARAGVEQYPYVVLRDVERFPSIMGLTVYRIVQESLTNTMKHAPGQPVSVSVRSSAAEGISLRIVNRLAEDSADAEPVAGEGDAVPFEAAQGDDTVQAAVADSLARAGSGAGLEGMRTRAEAVGGRADIGARGGEFVVEAVFPPPAAAAQR